MEMIDVLDKNANPTGEVKTRQEVHEHGLWHRDIHVYITNSANMILWQKRSPFKDTAPNKWSVSVGGHVDAGETYLQAAIRETREELGLNLTASDFELVTAVADEHESTTLKRVLRHHRTVFLITKDLAIETLQLDPRETTEVCWLTLTALENISLEMNPQFDIPVELPAVLAFIRARSAKTHSPEPLT